MKTKIVYEPKIVELKKNMAVVLPYEIEIHNGRLYDILAVDDEDFGEDDDHEDLEVIGNIHENPELLGGEE